MCWPVALLLPILALPTPPLEATPAEVILVDLELAGPGKNIDDPCFWVNPDDPSGTLVFVTTKDSGLVRTFGDRMGEPEGIDVLDGPAGCGEGGYLIVADQLSDATEFEIFDRVTLEHLGTFKLHDGEGDYTHLTDGIDILQTPLPGVPSGLLAACDGCADDEPEDTDVVSWDRIAEAM
mgnify:CR=1 FL=1